MYKKFLLLVAILFFISFIFFTTGDRSKWLQPKINPVKHSVMSFDFKDNALTYAKALPRYSHFPLLTPSYETSLEISSLQASENIFNNICAPLNQKHLLIALYDIGMADSFFILSPFNVPPLSPGRAIKIYGFKRLFNCQNSFFYYSSHQPDSSNVGILNICPAQKDDFLTAVVYKVNQEDFLHLRQAYPGYNLVPVVAQEYNQPTHPFFICYTWEADPLYINDSILPSRHAYSLIWQLLDSPEYIKKYGLPFSKDYLNTTFLADGHSVMEIHEEYK
ncbi:hypothetical protein [Candidatus Clavichlamydia salmonicola]|uniref:hypothetical protein n=1 Tax=Candidatus Clavichlamydia salmonicola TaxID=469812 RepID=UPI00189174B2|nr:hypothetical protein [Candidatus Clavichlamydia salmonicola]